MKTGSGKHRAGRATPEEIRETLGITKADRKIVHKVMTDLGYAPKLHPQVTGERGKAVRSHAAGKTLRTVQPEKDR